MKYKDAKEEIKNRVSIVDVIREYIPLKQSGSNFMGVCPFHPDKNPSMSVNESRKMFKCFACNEGGDVFHFLEKYLNISYFEAVKRLAKQCNVEIDSDYTSSEEYKRNEEKKEKLYKLHKDVANIYYKYLHSEEGKKAYNYLTAKRHLSDKTILKFGLGYAPKDTYELYTKLKDKGYDDDTLFASTLFRLNSDNKVAGYFFDRVMFPVLDISNNIIGFQSRALSETEEKSFKYLNSKTTLVFQKDSMLYGFNFVFKSKLDYYIICEGNMDVITLNQNGYDNAVGAQGTAFNEKQIFLLKRKPKKIYLCQDMDDAGIKAKNHVADMLRKYGFETYMIDLSPVKDVDEFLNDAKLGKEEFLKRLAKPIPSILYYVGTAKTGLNLDDPYDYEKYISLITQKLSSIENAMLREKYVKESAIQEGLDANKLLSLVNNQLKGNKNKNINAKDLKVEDNARRSDNTDNEALKLEAPFIYLCYMNPELREKIREAVSIDEIYDNNCRLLYEKYMSNVSIDEIFNVIDSNDQKVIDGCKSILNANYNYDEGNTEKIVSTLNILIRNIKIYDLRHKTNNDLDDIYETNNKIKNIMNCKYI